MIKCKIMADDALSRIKTALLSRFPPERQALFNPAGLSAPRRKQRERFLTALVKVIINLHELRHTRVGFTPDSTPFHDEPAFAPFVGNVAIALDAAFIHRVFGRTEFTRKHLDDFLGRLYRGTNLLPYGCSAYFLRPWLFRAICAWLSDPEQVQRVYDAIPIEPVAGDLVDVIHLTPREIERVDALVERLRRSGDIHGLTTVLSFKKQIVGGAVPQAYIIGEHGRYQGVGRNSLQRMPRKYRHQLLAGWYDYDVSAAAQTMLYQRFTAETGRCLPALESYIKNKDEFRERLAGALELTMTQAKTVLTSCLFAPRHTVDKVANDQRMALTITRVTGSPERTMLGLSRFPELGDLWNDCAKLQRHFSRHDFSNVITNEANYKRYLERYSKGRALAHKYFGMERLVLDVVRAFCLERGIQIIMIHDGFITNRRLNVHELRERIKRELDLSLSFELTRL